MLDQLGNQLTYPDAVRLYGKAQADAMFMQHATNPQPTSYLDVMQQRGQDAAMSGLSGLMNAVQTSKDYLQKTPVTSMMHDVSNLGRAGLNAAKNYEDGDLGRYIRGVGQEYVDQGTSGYSALEGGVADHLLGTMTGDQGRINRGNERLADATTQLGSIALDASDAVFPALGVGIGAIKAGGRMGGLMDKLSSAENTWVRGHNGGPSLLDDVTTPPSTGQIDTVDLPAGSRPEYLGAAPDRSGGSYPRYEPKNTPDRMKRLIASADDPNSKLLNVFDEKIEKGLQLSGDDWYNTEELRDWFTHYLGDEKGGAEWSDFMDKIGAGSTGSKVPENIRVASFYRALGPDAERVARHVKENKSMTPRRAAKELGIEVANMPPETGKGSYAYGHLKQKGHAGNIINLAEGRWDQEVPEGLTGAARTKWLQANPKVKGFKNSLVGNKDNIAADMHFMRLLGMADGGPDFLAPQASLSKENLGILRSNYGKAIEPYIGTRQVNGKPVVEVKLKKAVKDGVIKDTEMFTNMPSAWADVPDATEYDAYEKLAQRAAKRYNLTPAQFQAALWMGAGDLTNLADASQGTFMDLFRRSLDKRAGERSISRGEMLEDFIKNKAPLSVAPLAGAGMLGTVASQGGQTNPDAY